MSARVAVIDCGMGNLRSVTNAVASLGHEPYVARTADDLQRASAIILPGVGAFGDGMRNLRERGLAEALEREVRGDGKPFLGICLGMELLATSGLEHGRHEGLGWVDGVVERLTADDPAIKIPHIGWNDVRVTRTDGLYAGLGDTQSFYFVHSYHLVPVDRSITSAVCDHGTTFVASVETGNIMGTQYHPEKSQKAGLSVLRNFLQGAR